MGKLLRAGQIFVTSLDATPRESDILTGLASIDAGEITADEITVANLNISGDLSSTGDMQLSAFTNIFRMSATQIGIGTNNPVNDFQVGTNDFIINRNVQNLVTVKGNVASTNVIATTILRTANNAFLVDSAGSNVLRVNGNTYSTNVTVGKHLTVGPSTVGDANVAVFQNGNVVIQNGTLDILGDIVVAGNVNITDDLTYRTANNLIVSNAVIQMADGVPGGAFDSGLIMTDDGGVEANLVYGFSTTNHELFFGRTFGSAYTVGGPGADQTISLDSNTVNVHVYGDFYTDGNVGVANTTTNYTLSVGSNVYFDDTGSNVMYSRGNVYTQRLMVGTGGISVGDLLTMNPGSITPVVISSNVQMNAFRTTGSAPSGISNTAPTDTLSIGAKVFANLTASNTLTVVGTTVSNTLITPEINSGANVVVHADNSGGDSTSNALVLKSGPTASNVSAVEVYGASTSASNQNIRLKTKNTERLRVTSSGKIGIANTNPSEALTISGNVHVTGSNAVVYGNTWGSKGMRMYSNPNVGENKVENIVAAGKGINFYASQTSTMGTPKMTILETSNVGIGTSTPQGRLHTSGGTVFINNQPTRRNGFNHLGTPLVISNVTPINDLTEDLANVLHLAREGTAARDGVRATFKMGKYNVDSGKSRSKLDIFLADDRYTDETEVLTLRADGRVGIGHTQPTAFLEVKCTGIADPEANGLLVHNHDNGDAIMAVQADLSEGNAFSSYILADGVARSGWSVGVANNSDFYITEDHQKVLNPSGIAFYISNNSRNIGIGTDAPREKLEVDGNVVIGNVLTFGGLAGSEFGNTQFIERRYGLNQAKNELVIYKGNKGSGDEGKTRIRHIAAEHLFQTYDDAALDFADENGIIRLNENDTGVEIPLRVTDGGAIIIGGNINTTPSESANKLVVAGNIEFTAGGQFKLTGIEFETTNPVSGDSVNIYRNVDDEGTARAMTFVHEISGSDIEFARFDQQGRLGVGTDVPSSNVHIHDPTTSNSDVLKLTSNGAVSGTTQTGMLLYLDDADGGYVRGYHDVDNDIAGLVLGAVRDDTDADGIRITHTSNVGIGTTNPLTKFHVYDGVARIENSSSNAVVEFKTTGGTSNILMDTTGNVFINPTSTETIIASNLTVNNDLTVGGNIDLGDAVAIGLGGETANTNLQVGGGMITNSEQVACKRYSNTFTLTTGDAKDVQVTFGIGSFYAKIIAILRRIDFADNDDMSTLILEVQGGSHDGTTVSGVPIKVGTKNLFGGANSYPWSPTVTTGKRGISIVPNNTDSSRTYSYDIFVELVSSRGGGVTRISFNATDLDDGSGGQTLSTFNY